MTPFDPPFSGVTPAAGYRSIVLPYDRPALHIPRRDLVLGAADSLGIEVTIVESDNPDALPIELSGGIGGPALALFIWPWACFRSSWDYGAPWMSPGSPLWSGDGVISVTKAGTFNITFPPGSMATWPRRAGWSMQLAWDHDGQASQLAWGYLNVMPSGQRLVTPTAITTDSSSVILVA
jgi:hypothetical protein